MNKTNWALALVAAVFAVALVSDLFDTEKILSSIRPYGLRLVVAIGILFLSFTMPWSEWYQDWKRRKELKEAMNKGAFR